MELSRLPLLVMGALLGASRQKSNVLEPLPSGWARVAFAECCSIGLPRGATFSTARDAIDSTVHFISDEKLSLSLAVGPGPSLPQAAEVPGYALTTPQVAGRKSQDVAGLFTDDENRLPKQHYVSIPLTDNSDGDHLNLQFRCRDEGCQLYEPLLQSITVRR